MHRAARLYFEEGGLAEGISVTLTPRQSHYLVRVLRARPGDRVHLFHEAEGEWRARIEETDPRHLRARVEERVRVPRCCRGAELWFAPPKRIRLEWLVEKAVELGAARLCPVRTRRTVVAIRRPERLRPIAVEAAEQCGRLDVPVIEEMRPLDERLRRCRDDTLFFADEAGAGSPFLEALSRRVGAKLLVGPEGGFAPEERRMLLDHPGVVPVSLGDTVLRTETACLFMLSVWRARQECSRR